MPSDPCLRLRASEVKAAVFSGCCFPGRFPASYSTQTFIPGGLGDLEATGEGRGLAARGAHPQLVPCTPTVRIGA